MVLLFFWQLAGLPALFVSMPDIDLPRKKVPAWRRGLSKAGASSTVYIQYTIHPPSFNQIIKEL